jgi:hypothetical protein
MSGEKEIENNIDEHRSRNKLQEQRSAPDNVVIINYQIIINGMDIANESLKHYSELMENAINFNVNAMKMFWNPFLNPSKPKLDSKE